jgi:hypothetical protein
MGHKRFRKNENGCGTLFSYITHGAMQGEGHSAGRAMEKPRREVSCCLRHGCCGILRAQMLCMEIHP